MMMKKTIYGTILLVLVFTLVACGANPQAGDVQPATEDTAGNQAGVVAQGTPAAGKAPAAGPETLSAMQLALGTFKLDEMGSPLDPAQASQLATLWKAVRSLSQGETSAAQELEAVLKQIQDTLTPEQLQAIQSMSQSRRTSRPSSMKWAWTLAAAPASETPTRRCELPCRPPVKAARRLLKGLAAAHSAADREADREVDRAAPRSARRPVRLPLQLAGGRSARAWACRPHC